MAWDPKLYAAFAAPRLRPALDLLARIDREAPAHVVDLGCGTGNVTRLLAARWPQARIEGVDASAEMLAAATEQASPITWRQADIGGWAPDDQVDVLFSNAALHWLDDHHRLLPRLIGHIAPGGVLAVQMPHNHYAASHSIMAQAAEAGPWAALLRPLARRFPVADAAVYYDILSPLARRLDIWETEYLHVLEGDNPVVQWTMATALRPLLDALDEPQRRAFLAEYSQRIAAAYPRRADGKTVFAFRRLFLIAEI
ncbi:trans-aconitate 2-methyltransferase [Magnetospirillum sulfuroxidans]|uniref:Trans-aconitate 2-methyltransferase n=1 Tax=Magnetospirillum sulfuroxidans TaxID=611300 RepID=A0ABS5ID56_9PROT|nr:trans-aconitate 2-methyltransferase [Magnetospirillum sulfuroxidans]MBR9972354.1 trans-aconitate 2-methyltransferase [Magnetospirillum sulfuroxidans]